MPVTAQGLQESHCIKEKPAVSFKTFHGLSGLIDDYSVTSKYSIDSLSQFSA
jgi:hypothetical protein